MVGAGAPRQTPGPGDSHFGGGVGAMLGTPARRVQRGRPIPGPKPPRPSPPDYPDGCRADDTDGDFVRDCCGRPHPTTTYPRLSPDALDFSRSGEGEV